MRTYQDLYIHAIELLKQLISTPSFSKEEDRTAAILKTFLEQFDVAVEQMGNNIIVKNKYFDSSKPTILLNSHHDTVKPNPNYTKDPFSPIEMEGKLFGLGSNDAGGCLVSLIVTFIHFYQRENLSYNIVLVASAEEEISGYNGIEAAVKMLPTISFAIVGEPTLMQMAVAERGLMVFDVSTNGKAGHAARNEGENAISKAIKEISWFNSYEFEKVSPLLGPNKMSVTVIETENKAHNVVPGVCRYVVDVRVNELYTFQEVIHIVQQHVQSEVKPRSLRLRSTSIPLEHIIIKAGLDMGKDYYGSPTTSDKALMPFPALKMGPGDSARSHTADEFIYLHEIEKGIQDYIEILERVMH
ncbi:MAG TPA: M20 family metallo-hydrolase [Niabella sp.]|nr:M20 family metallo-hydrolase [Niabella sp.]HOZ96126.1 M20 family metallo-hydrolase [Niabella sp.]HQW13492.1 M20 family metallo-hydrolase [Niabella sp.]HQX18886.1 M20 family metallo-hydrolase [Niabella sp.]HQX41536.1 M20 family metallo-hydrolase [Niabella sp.]